jgi:voltage-gated potassium channel
MQGGMPRPFFAIARQRLSLLRQLESWLDIPMALLSAVWLYLIIAELGWELSPFGGRLAIMIWVMFIADFLLRFSLAPGKLRYIRNNWLTAVSLVLPALRVFRILRIFRILARLRALQLLRVLGSINRGMRALGKTMRRRGFGYVAALTVVVIFAGAAGMLYFEKDVLDNFWAAVWWTAMIITTMGTESWPKTPEGRILCLMLAIYAFSVFGYFTGVIATYFIGRDAADHAERMAARKDIQALKEEIAELREYMVGKKEREHD